MNLRQLMLGLALVVGSALAASTASAQVISTDTLLLQGVVGPLCTITVAPNAGVNDNLDLSVTAGWRVTLNVAAVTEDCNNPAGWTVDATAASGTGELIGTNPVNRQAYQVRYDGAGNPWNAYTAVPTNIATEVAPGPPGGIVRQVDVRYDIPVALPNDTYSDTITFTLTAP